MSDGQDENEVRRPDVAGAKRRAKKVLKELAAPVETPVDWLARRELIREREWAMHVAITDLALAIIRQMLAEGKGASLGDVVRGAVFGSEVGRLACNMPTSHPEALAAPATPAIRPDVEAALLQAYGDQEPSKPQ